MSHTPGPWTVHETDPYDPSEEREFQFWVAHDQQSAFVADVCEEADARLIAAAPDLLAALEENQEQQGKAVAIMRKHGFKFETPLDESEGFEKLAFTFYSMLCEVESTSHAAIAKAKGGGNRR